jgi:hypothetical protein
MPARRAVVEENEASRTGENLSFLQLKLVGRKNSTASFWERARPRAHRPAPRRMILVAVLLREARNRAGEGARDPLFRG